MSLSIFISREIGEGSPLLDLEADIYAASLIEIHVSNEQPINPHFNWIFFSSANAIKWVIDNNINLDNKKIASIGTPTAKKLKEAFGRADFVGKDHQEVEEISKEFTELVDENEKVLFPISSLSKKTIFKYFDKKYESIVAYETVFDPILFERDFDYLVFTSPSNFNSYFSANAVSKESKVIAIGNTTKKEIEKYLNIPIFIPKEKSENSIYELLKSLITDSTTTK